MRRRRTSILAALAVAASSTLALPAGADPREPPPAPAEQVVVQVAPPSDASEVVADAGAEPITAGTVAAARSDTGEVTAADVTDQSLDRLRADPRVASVLTRGTTIGLAMAESVPLIGAPSRWADGYRGDGKVIAVIDTGVDPEFGGTLVGSACFAATEVSFGTYEGHCGTDGDQMRAFDDLCFSVGVCRAPDALDPNAGRPCTVEGSVPSRECLHGTAVAAVAARHEPTPGVAPGAGIYGIRVFDPTGREADLVDVYSALEHVSKMARGGVEITSVNLSVATTSLFGGACDSSQALNGAIQAFRSIVSGLAAQRIPVVVASGNDGRTDELAFPACLSAAVSVGATDFDDELTPFSNAGPGLDLLAPGAEEANGARIPLDVPSAPGVPQQWAGTSFAAPHVAGALALVEDEYPNTTVEERVWVLRAGGVPVRSGATTRWRMGLTDADAILNAGVLFPGSGPVAGTWRGAAGDFDGDGLVDVLAHAPGSPIDSVSYGRSDRRFDIREHRISGTYLPLVGSFRGPARQTDDILWYAAGSAGDSLWEGLRDRSFRASSLVIDGTFEPHVGDFDGDGWDDVFWYAPGPDRDAIWYGGATGFASHAVSVRGSYRIAVGDFDGDRRDDVLFHGPGAATDSVWRGTSARGSFASSTVSIPASHLPFTGDFDGDGSDDVLLYAPGPTPDPLWLGRPGGFDVVPQSVRGTYSPLVGDVDGDGLDDITWYAPGPAGDSVWFGLPTGQFRSRPIGVSGSYQPLVGDVDGGAGEDIVWFNPAARSTPIWWSHIE